MSSKQEAGDTCKIKFTPSTFTFHIFTTEIVDRKVVYQIIKMAESVFVCINYTNGLYLNDLSLSMLSPYDKLPIGTQLLGDFTETTSKNMAIRISKKLNKNVFVSCNTDSDVLTLPLVEKHLYEEIKKCPDKF